MSKLLGELLPSSDEERIQLKKKYECLRTSLAGAQAEVYFGLHGDYPSLYRDKVAEIAEKLEEAGHKIQLDEVDYYTKELIRTPHVDLVLVKVPYLLKGLTEKCKQIVQDQPIYLWTGFRPRGRVIKEIGFDPYSARLADMIDEVGKSKDTKNRVTMEEVASREHIPVKDLYNFQRRLKYKKRSK